MKSIFNQLLLLFVFTINSLTSLDNTQNNLRILELLPNLLCPLAVEPHVPDNFVARSPHGDPDLYDWVYWGPEDVLKALFANPDSLEVPILRVQLSSNVWQTGPNSFSFEEEKANFKEDTFFKAKWGDYPVETCQFKMAGKLGYSTWVGLNDPEDGWTLLFSLVYPNKKGHPNEKDLELWENFLSKTTALKDHDFFKAYGQDLQEGYTVVNIAGAKIKFIAEKRESDGVLQVVVIPEDSGIEFHYHDMLDGLMGAKWQYGKPLVKVHGRIIVNNDNFSSVNDYVASILYKTVAEFSFKKLDGITPLIFQKP